VKRAELVVGARLYHTNKRDWETDEWGAKEVVVLDTDPWKERSYYTRRDKEDTIRVVDGVEYVVGSEFYKGEHVGGNGVLVGVPRKYWKKETDPDGPDFEADVVTLGSLKGDFETVDAEVKARVERNRELNEAAARAYRDREAKLAVLVPELVRLTGIEKSHYWGDTLKLGTDEVEKIVNKLREYAAAEEARVHLEECR
jgi:hypothetical protein